MKSCKSESVEIARILIETVLRLKRLQGNTSEDRLRFRHRAFLETSKISELFHFGKM